MSLQFIDEPVYIHKITKDLHKFHIESSSDEDKSISKEYSYEYCVMSIDIGILHLGLSVTTLDEEYNIIEIVWIDLIDITKFTHTWGIRKEKCKLFHTKTFCDWLNHVFQENIFFFEIADYILIERQPPMGLVAVEQLIFSRWREKAILISPNSMHKYFNIGHKDYDNRKIATEKIAKMFLKNKALVEQLGYYHRVHDITDSICIMLFWVNNKKKEYREKQREKRIMERKINLEKCGLNMSTEEWLEMHRYIPHTL